MERKCRYCALFESCSLDGHDLPGGPGLARQWEAEEAAADQNICFLANVALFPPFPPNLIQHPQHQGENIYWFGFKNV